MVVEFHMALRVVEERAVVVMHNGKVAQVVEVKVMVEAYSGLVVVEVETVMAAVVREVVEKYSIPVLAVVEKVAAAVLCTEVVMVAGVAQYMVVEGEVN